MLRKTVAVLMGGWSHEKEVSISSGQAVIAALSEIGYRVVPITVTRDIPALIQALTPNPDVVFNALHGQGGEDGVIQGVLEALGIPYTHSGVMASALAMDKVVSRRIFEQEGITVPPWKTVSMAQLAKSHPLPLPYVVKPIQGGSSQGIQIIHNDSGYVQFDKSQAEGLYEEELLVETYIRGREISVAVMGDTALGAIEICPHTNFYDYDAKYTLGMADHKMPAPIPHQDYAKALSDALKAHKALGCRGITRVDILYVEATKAHPSQFYVLELNSQPGMTPLSLVQEIAAHQGISFNQLVEQLVQEARCDHFLQKQDTFLQKQDTYHDQKTVLAS